MRRLRAQHRQKTLSEISWALGKLSGCGTAPSACRCFVWQRARVSEIITPGTGLLSPFSADTDPPHTHTHTLTAIFDKTATTKRRKKKNLNKMRSFQWCRLFLSEPTFKLVSFSFLMTSTAWLSSCHGNAVKERLCRSRGVSSVKPLTRVCCVTFERLRHPLLLPSFCMLISRNKSHFTLLSALNYTTGHSALQCLQNKGVWITIVWIMRALWGRNA